MNPSPPSRRETICFVVLTLAIAYALAAAFHLTGERYGILIRVLMCVPGMMAFLFMWTIRREPPRAVGFAFTGWKPWVAALLFPLCLETVAVALAYGVRALSGRADFIYFQPENIRAQFMGWKLQGMPALTLIALNLLLTLLPWLLIALAYRWRWPERVQKALPSSVAWLHHAFRALLWLPVFFIPSLFRGRPFNPPGELGEEIGWRGFLVRRWMSRPLTAAAITMPVWALFHLPVPFFDNQRGRYLQNIAFLGSIAMFAATMQALYIWSESVWPCAVLHLSWNTWNEAILGDVYGWEPGMFGGQFWIFNGEGPFGLFIMGAIALWLLRRWARRSERVSSYELRVSSSSP
jgi:hypothetical protein